MLLFKYNFQIESAFLSFSQTNFDCQRGMTRAIVAVEAHGLSSNGILEFKEIPALAEVMTARRVLFKSFKRNVLVCINYEYFAYFFMQLMPCVVIIFHQVAQMIEYCAWTDRFIELQLWTRITSLAYDNKMHNLVVRCSQFALRYAKSGTQLKGRRKDGCVYTV